MMIEKRRGLLMAAFTVLVLFIIPMSGLAQQSGWSDRQGQRFPAPQLKVEASEIIPKLAETLGMDTGGLEEAFRNAFTTLANEEIDQMVEGGQLGSKQAQNMRERLVKPKIVLRLAADNMPQQSDRSEKQSDRSDPYLINAEQFLPELAETLGIDTDELEKAFKGFFVELMQENIDQMVNQGQLDSQQARQMRGELEDPQIDMGLATSSEGSSQGGGLSPYVILAILGALVLIFADLFSLF